MSRIYLAHRAFTGPGYRANLERLRSVVAGCERIQPLARWRRALGCTAEDDPATGGVPSGECVALTQHRLIAGPDGLSGAADAVWLLPPTDALVEAAGELGRAMGLPVLTVTPAEVEQLVELGLRSARPLEATPSREDEGRPLFTRPEHVVTAYFQAAGAVLGARALPMSMRVQNGSNRHAQQARTMDAGLKIAAAEGVFSRARADVRWKPHTAALLWAVVVWGSSYGEAAAALQLPAMTAWRHVQGGLAALADAMRSRRVDQEKKQEAR